MTVPTNVDFDREQRLDEILAVYLNAVRDGSAPSRQQLLDAHPDLAGDLREFFHDQDCFDRLATPLRAALPPAAPPLHEFGDYTDLKEIARGGMGVVFAARQKSLQRRVALKMLLAGPLASADDVQRFRTEAEAAASLQHPHIIPIYEVGKHDGYPYQSMQLLEGGSLAQFAGRSPWLVEGRASARRVARLLIDIAAAVHYAHQRGILHRDLKPANILLDANGQAHVSDFGLAKRAAVGSKQSAVGNPIHESSSDCEMVTSDWRLPTAYCRLTRTGAILGTPAYMAPEQASGERGAVTVAADVYGLGAILYEMLTGEPPFRGMTPVETLRLVMEREPVAPSKLNGCVDRDLETICLKCLHKQPARRYASADELARDLQRYERGEPIQARPVGALERSWRWCKRQPAVAGLTLALLVTLTAAVSLLTALWFRAERHADRAETNFQAAEQGRLALKAANERIEEKRQEAVTAQADADASFHLTHTAVVEFSTWFLEELKQSPGLQPVQKAVLESTLGYFQKFIEKHGHDPAVRRDLAETYANIAHITAAIGSRKKAEEVMKKALAIRRELHREHPDDPEARRKLAGTLTNLAVLQVEPEQFATTEEARRTYEAFLQATPRDADLRRGLANTLQNIGAHYDHKGRPREALNYCGQAAAILLELLRDPRDIASQTTLASVFHNMAVQLSRQSADAEMALCTLHHSQLLREDLARRFPRDPRRRADVLGTQYSTAMILRDRGQLDDALRLLQEILEGREKVAAENPSVIRYQTEIAETHSARSDIYFTRKNFVAARADREQARDVYFRLMKRDPENVFFQYKRAATWFGISTTFGAQKNWREERHALETARDALAPLIERDPDNLEYRSEMGNVDNNLGLVLARLDHYEEAVAALQQGIVHSRLALEGAPHVATYRKILNANLGTLGEVERYYGHPNRAVTATLERRKLWPNNGGELYRIGCDLALAVAITREEDERASYSDLTLETLRQAVAAGFRDGQRLQKDKAFDAVRGRADFKQLLEVFSAQPRP